MSRRLIDWAAIRKAFELDNVTNVSELSRRFGVKRESIIKHRDSEKWSSNGQLSGTAQSNVVDILTRQTLAKLEEAHAVDAMVDEIVATSEAGKLAADFMIDLLKKAKSGKIRPAQQPGEQTEADVAKSVMSAYRTFTTTIRDNAGRRPGQATIEAPASVSKPRRLRLNVVTQAQIETA